MLLKCVAYLCMHEVLCILGHNNLYKNSELVSIYTVPGFRCQPARIFWNWEKLDPIERPH